MKVNIKDFDVEMEIKNNGIEFEVRSNENKFLGDFIVTKSGLIWCEGKTSRKNGVKISWDKFTVWAEARE